MNYFFLKKRGKVSFKHLNGPKMVLKGKIRYLRKNAYWRIFIRITLSHEREKKSFFYVILILGLMTLKLAWFTIFVLVIVLSFIHRHLQSLNFNSKIQKAVKTSFSLFIWQQILTWNDIRLFIVFIYPSWYEHSDILLWK